jgi:hypothetical protein
MKLLLTWAEPEPDGYCESSDVFDNLISLMEFIELHIKEYVWFMIQPCFEENDDGIPF